nr:ABC transporter G family member 11 [Ipomoea batatas]
MVEIWESVGADKQRKLKISKDLTRKNSTSFIIYPPMTPGILGRDERGVTLAEGFQRWRHFTLRGSGSQVTFPAARVTMKKHFSQSYKDWWTQVHGDYLERNIKGLVPTYLTDMQQEAGTSKKGKRPVQEDELIPTKRKKDIASKQIVDVVPVPSGEEEDRNFKRDRKRNRRSPSPVKDNVEMPVSGEAESSNKKMTGSDVGENEYSNNAPVQGSLGSQGSHGESQPDQIDMPEVSIFDGKDFVLEQFKVAVMNV